jgi:hypothetical protein
MENLDSLSPVKSNSGHSIESQFHILKKEYQNKIKDITKNPGTVNNSLLINIYKTIKEINLEFVSKLFSLDSLYLEAIDKTVHLKGRATPTFTEKEFKDITKEHSKLRLNFDDKIEKWNHVEKKLLKATDEKVLYGWMAKTAYMSQVKEGKIIHTGAGDYKTVKIIKNDEGLRAVSFLPVNLDGTIDESRRPVLSFRGTNPSNAKHLNDDLQPSIENLSFSKSKDEIEQELNFLTDLCNNQGCVVAGHSLGGALSQRATAEFAGDGLIAEAYYYNSPGVGDEIVDKYHTNIAGKDKPKVVDIHHRTDIVYRFGGSRIPGDHSLVLDTPSKISKLAAHKLNNLIEDLENVGDQIKLNDYKGRLNLFKTRIKHFILETGRAITSPLLKGIIKMGSAMKQAIPHIKNFFGDLRGQQIDLIKSKISVKELKEP